MGQARTAAEHGNEHLAVFAVGIKIRADFLRRLPPSAQGARRNLVDVIVGLHHADDVENLMRLLLEQFHIAHGNGIAHLVVFVVYLVHNARQAGKHPTFEHGQQNAVELLHCFGGAVHLLHQLFAFDARLIVLVAQALGHLALQIKNQAVFFTPCDQMQFNAHARQLLVAVHQQACFSSGEDAFVYQSGEVRAQALCFGQPQHGV